MTQEDLCFTSAVKKAQAGGQPAKPMGWNALTYPFNLTGNPAANRGIKGGTLWVLFEVKN